MDRVLKNWLSNLKLGRGRNYENMTVFPLSGPSGEVDYITLDEALKQRLISVTEVSEAGEVPHLRVANNSDKAILILAGEELVGAKQNRIANTSLLVGGKTTLIIPVSCVEQGRWAYRGREFKSEGNLASLRLRSCVAEDVAESLRTGGSFRAKQSRVWAEVEEVTSKQAVHSPTTALADVYKARRDSLDKYVKAFAPQDGQSGLVVLIRGRVAGVEAFSRSDALKKAYGKIIASYALDALERPEQVGSAVGEARKAASKFLQALKATHVDRNKSVGLGYDLRLRDKGLVGSALQLDREILCLSAFPGRRDAGLGNQMRRASARRDSWLN